MKIAFKFIALTLVLVFTVAIVYAQHSPQHGDLTERVKEHTVQMTEELSLSSKQAEKVNEINLKYANKICKDSSSCLVPDLPRDSSAYGEVSIPFPINVYHYVEQCYKMESNEL